MAWLAKHRLDLIFILGILIAGSLALFFKIGEIPPPYPWSDESEIAADAVATLNSGPQLFYPGQLAGGSLAVWLEAGWMALFGRNLVGLRVLNGLVNLISAVLLYLLVGQLPFIPQRAIAVTAALLFVVSTWLLGLGRMATPNWSLTPLLATLVFYLFWLGLNTGRRGYFLAAGLAMGLLFYGYLPGYFVPLVLALFLTLTWLIRGFYGIRDTESVPNPPVFHLLLPFLVALLVAAPILSFFALNPQATLQRPLQLADTNELSAPGSWWQSGVDFLSTFGLYPNWLVQGHFQYLAFDPLVTILFVIGLLLALWRWPQPAYLFLLIWWGVMIAPAILSRSASQGFIFEVWRRGVGAQPVSFIFPALAVGEILNRFERFKVRATENANRPTIQPLNHPNVYLFPVLLMVIISAGLSYWLYFNQWANSGVMTALFAEAPVRLVEWMEAESRPDLLYVFPVRPNVSPTTRPELFTVRYLYDGPAQTAFPVLDETTIGPEWANLLAAQPAVVKLMQHSRIEVDPKGYFEYALGSLGAVASREQQPDYRVTTYHLRPGETFETALSPAEFDFGGVLRLTGYRLQPGALAAGQTLGAALRWLKQTPAEADYNAALALYDSLGYEWAKVDKPLLGAEDYLTTRHWPPGTESNGYYALTIPPDAPPDPYTVRVVAYNAATGAPLPPAGGETDLSLRLAEIEVRPNPLPVDPAALPVAQIFDTQIPGGLRLIGVQPSAASARPGDKLAVAVWWQADEVLAQNIGLMLALAVPDGRPTLLFDAPQPLLAGYPTSTWPAGSVYRANYQALIPAQTAGGEYALAMRLFNLDTLEPLAEQLLLPVSIEARPHVFDAPALANELNVDFENAIRLRGFEFDLFSPDQTVLLKLQWQALRPIPESYKIFAHLTDPAGQIVSQVDTLPQQGAAPTTGWLAGEIIEDELQLAVPPELPAGSYRLVAGLYNEKTGARLRAGQDNQVVLVEKIRLP
ncbi:MAG: glycosyltransferase family 39 protein [Anaerolineae bacterium]|nr:glycosyltransferase family 39 protein [Anaerolineae bacterium]